MGRNNATAGTMGTLAALCAAGCVGLVLDILGEALRNDKHYAHSHALRLLQVRRTSPSVDNLVPKVTCFIC